MTKKKCDKASVPVTEKILVKSSHDSEKQGMTQENYEEKEILKSNVIAKNIIEQTNADISQIQRRKQ